MVKMRASLPRAAYITMELLGRMVKCYSVSSRLVMDVYLIAFMRRLRFTTMGINSSLSK